MADQKSMLEVARKIISKSKSPVKFKQLWKQVCDEMKYDEIQSANYISLFYTQLTVCGFIVQVKNNAWDLSERVPFNQRNIKLNEDDEDEAPASDLSREEKESEDRLNNKEIEQQEENIDGQSDTEENQSHEIKIDEM